jgi:hypothetical protein
MNVHHYELLERTPATLSSLARDLPDEILSFREKPGAWTIPEIVRHLTDGEVTDWMPRIRRILSDEPHKPFEPFDREGGFARYGGWPVSRVLDEFARLRRQNLDDFSRLRIGADSLQRTGVHPELGAVTLEQLIDTWVTHDFAHLAQISRILTRYFGQNVGPWKGYFSLLQEG